jgi:ribonuclease HI
MFNSNLKNQHVILFADASAPSYSKFIGLGGVVVCSESNSVLKTYSKALCLNRSCTLHAELFSIAVGLSKVPENCHVTIRSDSISALWLLHVAEIISYEDESELFRMAGGKQNRLKERKLKQVLKYQEALEECQNQINLNEITVTSRWIKGHSGNTEHNLADSLASKAFKEAA